MATNEEKLMLLRIQLYGAAQLLKGEDAEAFWELINEIVSIRPAPGGREE